jgi:hypothetical protein
VAAAMPAMMVVIVSVAVPMTVVVTAVIAI